jgi:hypothetical protein
MTAELINIDTPPTDAQLAKSYTARLMPLLEQAARVMDEIRRDGMEPQFALNFDGTRTRIVNFDIKKSMI